jgi:hypothetical protein
MRAKWPFLAIFVLFFGIVSVRAYIRVVERRQQKREQMMTEYMKTPEGYQQAMTDIATFATRDAKKEFGVVLDYSPQSVERVEEILDKIHQQHTKKPIADKDIARRAYRFGIYIGEVIRKHHAGTWKIVTPENFDPMKYEITHKNKAGKAQGSFPVNWCGKRIYNGEEDNVWHKYLFLVEDAGNIVNKP